MQTIGKPYKFGSFQIQKIIDNYGEEKIQIKYFSKNRNGNLNFSKFQAIYVLVRDWDNFKTEIKRTK